MLFRSDGFRPLFIGEEVSSELRCYGEVHQYARLFVVSADGGAKTGKSSTFSTIEICRSELWYFRNLPFAIRSVVFVQTTRVCAINKIRRETASLSNCALDFVKEL